jgi:hypothetical protein
MGQAHKRSSSTQDAMAGSALAGGGSIYWHGVRVEWRTTAQVGMGRRGCTSGEKKLKMKKVAEESTEASIETRRKLF